MRTDWEITASTIESQRQAADPAVSAWVSANAGSGKTHVLANRVVRLLLDGVAPGRILCLTYTKAAAANMSTRVFGILGEWTQIADDELSRRIAAIEGAEPDADRLARARRLFAEALETPGGLKIQTIHAFCEAVLHQFPLEAGIAGHFEMMDTAMEAALLADSRRWLLTRATGGDERELFDAFDHVMARGGEHGLDTLLSEIIRKRDDLLPILADRHKAMAHLRAHLGLDADATAETVAASALPLPGFDEQFLLHLESHLAAKGTGTAENLCQGVREAWAAFEKAPTEGVRKLQMAFFTKAGDPYKEGSLVTKAMRPAFGDDGYERYLEACEHIQAIVGKINTLDLLNATEAAMVLAEALLGRYERSKTARGLLDFSDLVTRTAELLTHNNAAAWVQYKLDRGLDHLLVDEAQDTSPRQWQVIESLATEFFSGEGARSNHNRTVFAVGDEKQSIYSFQGAEPGQFSEAGARFRKRVRQAAKAFHDVRLRQSFRSTPDVLAAVDRTFGTVEARTGLSHDGEAVEHETVRARHAGEVELWPYLSAEETETPPSWTEGRDPSAAPAAQLAEEVASRIAGWLRQGERLPGKPGAMKAGDVLVLVRKRDRFIHALARALKQKGVPVAGTDRLHLSDHIAVRDLTAIGRFVQQPNDDLALAALLKSPLFGFTDDDLMVLLLPRDSRSLWQRLRQLRQTDPRFAQAAETLRQWRDDAGYRRPADFFAAVLGRDGGRRRLVARLGQEAAEIIDEFQRFVMAQEMLGITDMERVVDALGHSAPEIKREMEQGRDEVRIMTVHASKGLEAPVVFLVDSGGAPSIHSHLPLLMKLRLPAGPAGPARDLMLWRAPELGDAPQMSALKSLAEQAQENEYRRLLYVGMTRAEDRLIVCGYCGKKPPDKPTWLNLVQAGLEHDPAAVVEDEDATELSGGRRTIRFAPSGHPPIPAEEGGVPTTADHGDPPFDIDRKFPPPAPAPRPLSPSGAGVLLQTETDNIVADTLTVQSPVLGASEGPASWPIRKGLAVHRLIELLADAPADEWEAACRRWLAARDFDDAQSGAVIRDVLATMADPAIAAAFAPGSRAEVALAGTVTVGGQPRSISGFVDRLAVSDEEVLIVDFKTNMAVPGTAMEVQDDYLAQMALYRALLRPLYPSHAIRCALVYTGGPSFVTLPEALLDETASRLRIESRA